MKARLLASLVVSLLSASGGNPLLHITTASDQLKLTEGHLLPAAAEHSQAKPGIQQLDNQHSYRALEGLRTGQQEAVVQEAAAAPYHPEAYTGAQATLHTVDTPPPAVGLPEDCLSYKDRYRHQYSKGLHHSFAANALHPHSRYVVVLKLHQVHKESMPQDVILNLRALAAETTQAGYHFYILYQVPTRDFYMLTEIKETELTREEMLEFLPMDLRPFIIMHDFEADFAAYPKLGADDGDTFPTFLWGPGPRAAYVAMSQFMQRYKAYQYAWILEYDVRWLGSSWGTMLNAAVNLAVQATPEELAADPRMQVKMDRLASRALPDPSAAGLPDLLSFGEITKSDKWRDAKHNMNNATTLWEMQATVYMGSRRLWDAVHEFSEQGIGAHIEACLPTIAMQRGMKAAALAVKRHSSFPESFHCCLKDAGKLYAAWYNNSGSCVGNYLLHPVKTTEAFWPAAILQVD